MKKLISTVLALAVMFSMISCGQSNDEYDCGNETTQQVIVEKNPLKDLNAPKEEEETVSAAVYDELIGQIYETIAEGNTMADELEGTFSLYAGLGHLSAGEMMAAAGYAALRGELRRRLYGLRPVRDVRSDPGATGYLHHPGTEQRLDQAVQRFELCPFLR